MARMQILPALAGLLTLTGCVQIVEPDPSPYPFWSQNVSAAEAMGALAGGALGGYLGAQFGAGTGAIAMTGLGVAAGAALGRELGRNLEHPQGAVAQPVCAPDGRCPPAPNTPPAPGNPAGPSVPDPH